MPTLSEAFAVAVANHQAGRLDLAEEICRRILAVEPGHADAHHLLGIVRQQQGDLHEALERFRQAVSLNPQLVDGHKNLAAACHELGRSDEAVVHSHQALRLRPDDPVTHYNLGTILLDQGRAAEAIACYRRSLELFPDLAPAWYNLGNALVASGRLQEASESYQQALAVEPDLVDALNNLGSTWLAQGRLGDAMKCFRRALELNPRLVEACDNLLCVRHYQSGTTLAELAAEHRQFGRSFCEPLRAQWRPHDNLPDPDRRLRIGFVSPDFGRHPVGHLAIGTLENLDRAECEVVCYSNRQVADEMTARFQRLSGLWRNVVRTPDDRLAEEVRADRIDILFDLAGHTARNRLGLFARKPAPIQITWLGYPGTTGLEAMDYLLADRYQVPAEAEAHYVERVLRMPEGYVCFEPPEEAPPVGPLPALADDHVTLGSFNNPVKITPEAIAVWGQILRRLPSARLVLAHRGFDAPGVGARLQGLFAGQGVAPDRVQLIGWMPREALLAHYNQIDLALDVLPYNGGLTTCEALWMGVPVVTCPGETFASRHSLSHLSAAGFTETIAGDLDLYAEIAVRLASDLPRLAEIRAGLRPQVARSPLCDGKRFAGDLLTILRGVWREWCAGHR